MPTQILPAASLRSANRLPAGRTLAWVVNHLICMASWSIGRAIFRIVLNYLPALRERRALVIGALRSPNGEGFRDQRQYTQLFPVIISNNSGPAAADRTSGRRRARATPMMQGLRIYLAAGGLLTALLAMTASAGSAVSSRAGRPRHRRLTGGAAGIPCRQGENARRRGKSPVRSPISPSRSNG